MQSDTEARQRAVEDRIRALELQMAEIMQKLVQTGQIITLVTQAGGQ